MPDMNAKISITGEGAGKETGKVQKWKDDIRSTNLTGGRSWSSSWLTGEKK